MLSGRMLPLAEVKAETEAGTGAGTGAGFLLFLLGVAMGRAESC